MPVFYARKRDGALWPQSRAAQIEFDKLPVGLPLRVKAVRTRSRGFHRGSWAFFTYVAAALNDGPTPAEWTPEDVKDVLLVATGYARIARVGGREIGIPKHTNFDAMDDAEYNRFMQEAFAYVRDELCKWIEDSQDYEHVLEIMRHFGALAAEQGDAA